MKFVKLLLAVALASAQDKEISSTSESKETVKTLFKANDTQLDYTFKTVLETYTDNSKARFLHGELELSGVRTYYAGDPVDGVHDEIRLSVGWRNPEEDGYDVTSFTFKYDTDQSKITKDKVVADDGYSVGSIDSFYYNWEYKDKDDTPISKGYNYIKDGSTFDTEPFTSEVGQDCYGSKNITIKQWTDKKNKDGTVDYRVAEDVDITILDVSVSDRPSTDDNPTSAQKNEVVQTFTVSYKRPFKASELSDINLEAGDEYNITSAYGCYKGSTATGPYDPDSLSVTIATVSPAVLNDIGIASSRASDYCDDPLATFYSTSCDVITTYDTSGCFGAWQASEGIMVWSQPYKKEVSGNQIWTERSISGVLMSLSDPKNGRSDDITGMIETQITVLLLENAKICMVGVLTIISVFASLY